MNQPHHHHASALGMHPAILGAPPPLSLGPAPTGMGWFGLGGAPSGAAWSSLASVGADSVYEYSRAIGRDGHGRFFLVVRASPKGGGRGVDFFYRAAPARRAPFLGQPPIAYDGAPDRPYPPSSEGWFETTYGDECARGEAANLLGELPTSTYADRLLPSGLYRFFAFEGASGAKQVGGLRFWGTSTLGAEPAISPASNAAADLAAFDQSVSAGDSYLGAGEYQNAVTAYQAAGSSAVVDQAGHLAHDLDIETGGASVPLTGQAWTLNGSLQGIDSSSAAGQQEAASAAGYVKQMQNLYHQAVSASPPPSVAPSATLASAAAALATDLTANGCTTSPTSTALAFQTQYNLEGRVQITPDGKYGGETQGALQRVLDATGGGAAPANCFGPSPAPSGGGSGGGGGRTDTYDTLSATEQSAFRAALLAAVRGTPCPTVDISGITSVDSLTDRDTRAAAVDCFQTTHHVGAAAGILDTATYQAVMGSAKGGVSFASMAAVGAGLLALGGVVVTAATGQNPLKLAGIWK